MPFPHCRHQISFVSDQLVPTILAAIQPGAEPACVHGIVTLQMKDKSRILKEALENRGRRYQEYVLHDTGQEAIFSILDKVRDGCQGESIALNLTGGTKLMTLAAAEWAYASDVPTFYMDTGTDKIVWMPPKRRWEYLPLPDLLDVRGLLAAGGYRVIRDTRDAVPGERHEQLRALVELLCATNGRDEAARALQALNGCAQGAKGPERLAEDRATPSPAWRRLRERCHEAGMLDYDNGYIHFPSETARQWCNGLWFEEYVRMILYKMHSDKRIPSWAASVEVEMNGVPNELDALFSVRNRLFVIECKTAALSERDKANSVLYKADSLRDRLGGLFATSAICSVLPLNDRELKRAKELRIRVLSGKKLLRLEETLAAWASQA